MRILSIVLTGLFFIAPPVFAETIQPAVPIDRPAPEYPVLSDEVEGYVKLHFTIGKDGHVKDAVPFESSPPGLFDAAAVAGLSQWTYKPRTVDGVAVDQPGNGILLRFKPSPTQPAALLNPMPPYYPKEAFDNKLEGSVTVGYDIDERGMTQNVKVLSSTAPGIFDEEAVRSVSDQVFRPRKLNGVAQGVEGLTTVVEFKLAEARLKPKVLKMVPPPYPDTAAFGSIMGFCVINFTIETDGSVSNPVIVASYPHGVFEKTTLNAFKSWKFEPQKVPITQAGFTFKYTIHGSSNRPIHYLKPGQWVKLNYTLQANGTVSDVAIIEASDPSVPTMKAVEQLRAMKFAPHTDDGQPVVAPHQVITINGPKE